MSDFPCSLTREFGAESMLEFTVSRLSKSARRILEVGCGYGDVALGLMKNGFDVVAIDPAEEAIELAKQKGVDARKSDFLSFSEGVFDVVLFTRSLHHMHPLETTIEYAYDTLSEGGQFIAVDFDYRAMDEKTTHWFYGLKKILLTAGLLPNSDSADCDGDLLRTWIEHHEDHDVNAGSEMARAVEKRFGKVSTTQSSYLFRYFINWLGNTDRDVEIARAISLTEETLCRLGSIKKIGLEFIATK